MTTLPIPPTTAASTAEPARGAPASRTRLAIRAFAHDRAAVAAAAVIALVLIAAICAPVLTPYDPYIGDSSRRLEPVLSPGHLLGLDGQGRDILTRLLYGARNSLTVAIVPVIAVFPIAVVVGLVAGAGRSRAGEFLIRLLDVVFAFPLVLLALALSAILGGGLVNVMLAIGITLLPYMTRVAYNATIGERDKEYVEAAVAAGMSKSRILFRQLLPNVVSPVVVYATSNMGLMIVTAAGLSFLGVGVSPPAADWGVMTSDGSSVLLEGYAHVATIPGIAILIVALAFNLIGDGVRDALDPHKIVR